MLVLHKLLHTLQAQTNCLANASTQNNIEEVDECSNLKHNTYRGRGMMMMFLIN